MTYDIIIFTECNARIYHSKTLGPHRIATELRNHGYSVKVIDFFASWLKDPVLLFNLLKSLVGSNTLFIGFSGIFFNRQTNHSPSSWKEFAADPWTGWPETEEKKLIFLRKVRKVFPHVKIVFGGVGTSSRISHAAVGMDYIVQGLADITVIELANHLAKNQPLKFMLENGVKIISHDTLARGFDFAHSRVDYVPEDNIIPGQILPIETSRGCLFKCSYCDYPLIGRKKEDPEYHKTVETLAQEFRNNWQNYQVNHYKIMDDTFNETTKKIENVLRSRDIAGVDIKFSAYIRAELLSRYPEQIKLLSDLGLMACFLGIETFDAASGKSVGKSSAPEKIKEVLYQMKDQPNPSRISAGFIIGLPNDNPETLEKWLPWIDDPGCPIDKIHTNTLQMADNSDISKNPEKYGYTIIDQKTRAWKNQYWTQYQAAEYLSRWQERWWNNSRLRIAGWDYMGFMELGYSEEELKRLTMDKLDWQDIDNRNHAQWINYRDRVLQFEMQ